MKKKFRVLQPLLKRSPHGAAIIKTKLMLSSISWQQFLAALVIITLVYYFYIGLRYYQKDLRAIANRKKVSGLNQGGTHGTSYQVMGVAKQEHGVSVSDADHLHFAIDDEPETETIANEVHPVANTTDRGPTEALLNDVSQLINAFKEVDDKAEFLSLLRIQYDSYHADGEAIDWPAVKQQTLQLSDEKLPFSVSEVDVQLS
ncbi:hypothetical protein [Mucilaginibacter sp. CSA2-8R]|uniref:hypothetical protein n=1 Tax=Mucilaginibacter sp. CSA2-8R TaxID=3141542 RepID=UPI00315C97D8